MKSEFWHERWSNDETDFHLDEPNPAMVNNWPTLPIELGNRVLLPLCGKSVDVLWLLKQGYQIVGVELSEIALDALAESIEEMFSLAVDKQEVDGLILYRAAGILLICGDWFKLTARDIGPVHAVYDRAALIAMPEEMRESYCEQLMNVAGAVPQLLVTIDYHQADMAGPPFSVPADQIEGYYADSMTIDVLHSEERINKEPRFRDRGLTSLNETVYRLIPKS